MPKNVKAIETIEEYQDALASIARLDASMPNSPEEDESRRLLQAVEKWEHDHGGEKAMAGTRSRRRRSD
jgi:hypothetical protein